jgi:hypothetical protein
LPFLRFNRDKRGYETTSLLHAFPRRGRARPRVLYWFRSPGEVRVGRSPLDEDVIRLLEEQHPEIRFDWPKILDGLVSVSSEERASEDRPRRPVGTGGASANPRQTRGRQRHGQAQELPTSEPERGLPTAVLPAVAESPGPGPIEEEADDPGATSFNPSDRDVHAAGKRFSGEDLARLRGRYAALLARIDQHTADATQAGEVRARVETLNPDGWVTPADVEQALEHYEATYKALQDLLGWSRESRRRRRRRPDASRGGETPA